MRLTLRELRAIEAAMDVAEAGDALSGDMSNVQPATFDRASRKVKAEIGRRLAAARARVSCTKCGARLSASGQECDCTV